VDDPDQTAIIGRIPRLDPAPPAWDDSAPEDEAAGGTGPAGDTAAGLASLSFIMAAIRRRRRTALIFAIIGLFLGAGLFVAKPPPYRASTEVFLTLGPNENANTAIDTDEALATSRPVAVAALNQLGPVTSVNSLLASVVAVPVTDRVLLITVTEHSAAGAVSVAKAVTSAFLQYRNSQLEAYDQLVTNSLNQQISKGQAKVTTLTQQIAALTGRTKTATAAAQLSTLKGELTQAASAQTTLVAGARSTQQTTDSGTSVAVNGSSVINAAALIPKSRPKQAIIYALTGLFAGGALSIGVVVIIALISDRLRWRDDIAHALGTSVRLSVGPVRLRRWLPLPGHRGLDAVSDPRIQRVARHLRGRVSAHPGSGLAVVPADRDDVAAVAIVALALSCAEQGSRVILADLCPGAPAARLLKAADPGLHQVEAADTRLMVMVPEASEFAAAGPLKPAGAGTPARPVSPELTAAYSTADTLLTLAALDPMLGAEHLATWATDAVVLVTAGESTWTRVEAVGEMVRLADVRLASAVVVGADQGDESLGRGRVPEGRAAGRPRGLSALGRPAKGDRSGKPDRPADPAKNGSSADIDGLVVTLERDPGTTPDGQ
jgi:hypothetical protein